MARFEGARLREGVGRIFRSGTRVGLRGTEVNDRDEQLCVPFSSRFHRFRRKGSVSGNEEINFSIAV